MTEVKLTEARRRMARCYFGFFAHKVDMATVDRSGFRCARCRRYIRVPSEFRTAGRSLLSREGK